MKKNLIQCLTAIKQSAARFTLLDDTAQRVRDQLYADQHFGH